MISTRKNNALKRALHVSNYPATWHAILRKLGPILSKLSIKDCIRLIEIHQDSYAEARAREYRELADIFNFEVSA